MGPGRIGFSLVPSRTTSWCNVLRAYSSSAGELPHDVSELPHDDSRVPHDTSDVPHDLREPPNDKCMPPHRDGRCPRCESAARPR